ncbi:hypothetical protein [Pararhodobacter sp. CCB-MM2]|uniref:hypothetical protein n=1 Tax=Pararhodobacter sp. CCB-MM2 TaxID=1786003 RepID=UPI0008313EB4|nr:hypothetical protein [Pararhodobacter sp. CCB-MM2]
MACDKSDQPRLRPGRPDEQRLDDLQADPFDRFTLSLMRWHFQGFAEPECQGWLSALRLATEVVGPARAPALCYDIVALVEVVRATRRSVFRFNPEACAGCRQWVTPEERRMLSLLSALRSGRDGLAATQAQLLSDGRPNADLIRVAGVYLARHDERARQAA